MKGRNVRFPERTADKLTNVWMWFENALVLSSNLALQQGQDERTTNMRMISERLAFLQ